MAKRVYFAFHYKDVADFRANVVRKHNVVGGVDEAGYYDASIWEESKKKGVAALKQMIDAELENTTVTAVLIGAETFARRWVKYEIFRSFQRGNRVIGVHINNVPDKFQNTVALGPNPFEFLALSFDQTGRVGSLLEYLAPKWETYPDLGSYSVVERPDPEKGKAYKLSTWARTYDWIADRGYDNFEKWIS